MCLYYLLIICNRFIKADRHALAVNIYAVSLKYVIIVSLLSGEKFPVRMLNITCKLYHNMGNSVLRKTNTDRMKNTLKGQSDIPIERNLYAISIRILFCNGVMQRKERDGLRLSSAVPKIQWDSNPHCPYGY